MGHLGLSWETFTFTLHISVNSNVLYRIFVLSFSIGYNIITKSVADIPKFFSDSLFLSLTLPPNIITTEDPIPLGHDAMFLGQ